MPASSVRAARRTTALIALSISALLLVGCANSSSATSDAGAESSDSMPAAEGHATYPLTLESPYGETVLQERPTRIAAIVPNASDTELLFSLGVTPVLSSSLVTEGGYLTEYGAETVDTYEFVVGEDIPVEAIAASDPDLIVAVGWLGGLAGVSLSDYYDRLSTIAPVLASPETSQALVSPWQDSIGLIGEALDLSDAADAVIDDYETQLSDLRDAHPEFDGLTGTWTIYYGAGTGLQYLSQPDSAPAEFLEELGFAPNPGAAAFSADPTVSDELLSKIDADVIVLGQSAHASDAEFAGVVDGSLFQNLGAVSAGHLVTLPPRTDDGWDPLWAITSGGPIGNAKAAQYVAPLLADVL
ncbi:ABC transporter substrate-binding protein [Leucobacter japonicus]|uniref:ABC transporter substrate-binding protein n=1 Tax=Leucobacter japonicus TaxID=1461259 RepID=UPI0006A79C54|nr:ABC transporter substrate-binding protein [Leucobacter japonicus]